MLLEALRDFFDEAAPRWATRSFDQALMERLIDCCKLGPGARVVDLGGGTGHLLPTLRQRVGPSGCLCLIDLSLGMLRQAASLVATTRAWRCCGQGEHLPLRTGQWDAVIGMGLYPHLDDPLAVLAEIWRVLVPGGRVAFLHLIGRAQLNALHQQLGGIVATHLLPAGEEVAQTLATAGFAVERVVDREDSFLVLGSRPHR